MYAVCLLLNQNVDLFSFVNLFFFAFMHLGQNISYLYYIFVDGKGTMK